MFLSKRGHPATARFFLLIYAISAQKLQNVIERAVIMTTGSVLDQRAAELITGDIRSARIRTLIDAERAHIIAMLNKTNWVVGGPDGAAAQLGLARTTLIAMMVRLGISRKTLPQGAGAQRAGEPDRPFVMGSERAFA
jgi:hypothetical protein